MKKRNRTTEYERGARDYMAWLAPQLIAQMDSTTPPKAVAAFLDSMSGLVDRFLRESTEKEDGNA